MKKKLPESNNDKAIDRIGQHLCHIRYQRRADLIWYKKSPPYSRYVLDNIEKGCYKNIKFIALVRLADYYGVTAHEIGGTL